ncbi:sulfurtransferase [Bacteroidales bacterium]|nr:sulfurtransferase [Bacteroidales bacterium]
MAEFFSRLFAIEDKADFKGLLQNGAVLVDVRTEEEYKQGHSKNSLNIPLDTLSGNLSKLKKDEVIICVCQSGVRSKNAATILRSNGFNEVYNGGSWSNF